jgi:protein-S-isoprenylcysteine O-methyltransferase Ste14
LSDQTQSSSTAKKTFWAAALFYLLIAFEFFYMASPFAFYFYSVYGPALNFVNDTPALAWLVKVFLPHYVMTSSELLNLHNLVGMVLALLGFSVFCTGAGQVYYNKLARKGIVTGGVYNYIRHPQYVSLLVCSFGMLLLWPRYIVLVSFITVLFAYYFLARIEEKECIEKHGQSYIDYMNRTGMFLPHVTITGEKLPSLPGRGPARYLTIMILYLAVVGGALAAASTLGNWTQNSLYALYAEDAVYLSVDKIDDDVLRQITSIALTDPEVRSRLEVNGDGTRVKFINYVLPAKWNIPEIPLNPIVGVQGHYTPEGYDKNLYKIVFTRAEFSKSNINPEGREILSKALSREPVAEAWVDISNGQIIEVKNPPVSMMYEGIPVPMY